MIIFFILSNNGISNIASRVCLLLCFAQVLFHFTKTHFSNLENLLRNCVDDTELNVADDTELDVVWTETNNCLMRFVAHTLAAPSKTILSFKVFVTMQTDVALSKILQLSSTEKLAVEQAKRL